MCRKGTISYKAVAFYLVICIIGAFCLSNWATDGSLGDKKADDPSVIQASILGLPSPNQLLKSSAIYSHPVLRGIKIDPRDPFRLEFIIDTEDKEDAGEEEISFLIRYFLAALTVPEEDLWVNLSPYEADRVVPDVLSQTDLGKDLLGQDYVLKQLVASLMYPESEIGKKYWDKTYKEVYKLAKTTNIPIDTFNKVWIVPERAEVYENDNVAVVIDARLKVMHEMDYFALSKQTSEDRGQKTADRGQETEIRGQNIDNKRENLSSEVCRLTSEIMKETVLPQIEGEVNEGKSFSKLRQIYHSLILATWFKRKLKDSIYQYYIDQGKIKGVDLEDKDIKNKIYNLYVESFKKGVYDYIKADYDPVMRKNIKRRYYSGGINMASSSLNTDLGLSGVLKITKNFTGFPMRFNPIRVLMEVGRFIDDQKDENVFSRRTFLKKSGAMAGFAGATSIFQKESAHATGIEITPQQMLNSIKAAGADTLRWLTTRTEGLYERFGIDYNVAFTIWDETRFFRLGDDGTDVAGGVSSKALSRLREELVNYRGRGKEAYPKINQDELSLIQAMRVLSFRRAKPGVRILAQHFPAEDKGLSKLEATDSESVHFSDVNIDRFKEGIKRGLFDDIMLNNATVALTEKNFPGINKVIKNTNVHPRLNNIPFDQIPMAVNPATIQYIREVLGFNGLIIPDWLSAPALQRFVENIDIGLWKTYDPALDNTTYVVAGIDKTKRYKQGQKMADNTRKALVLSVYAGVNFSFGSAAELDSWHRIRGKMEDIRDEGNAASLEDKNRLAMFDDFESRLNGMVEKTFQIIKPRDSKVALDINKLSFAEKILFITFERRSYLGDEKRFISKKSDYDSHVQPQNKGVFNILFSHGVGQYDFWNRTGIMTLVFRQKVIEHISGKTFAKIPQALSEEKRWFNVLMRNREFLSYYDQIDWYSDSMNRWFREQEDQITSLLMKDRGNIELVLDQTLGASSALVKDTQDSALTTQDNLGGIDLNPDKLNITTAGSSVQFSLSPETIHAWREAEGLTFTIIKIDRFADMDDFLNPATVNMQFFNQHN
ncbi:MAG: hypothetical protein ABH858_01640 [Candidatus Omnitrophota bacterium]